ncbi:SCO1664 family protein [uncultured Thermanaerothrix sp.]|uniref:SCO1664 family protein n=1 Tax=uncultured Thermanaerothrix sp. TaxID=1195149 RepID=UPI002611203F|nr:SCO1664 family protein [uncultured Thermanaerothrix sp.]
MNEVQEATPIIQVLEQGEITLRGEMLLGSNYTFLVQVRYQGEEILAVYKPTRGEQPLWDFPPGTLAMREVAAYVVSQALGWDLVPPTVYRRRGPLGKGSLQRFIEHDPEYHYFTFTPEDRQRLRPVALFDALVNNADRKGGHILFDAEHHLWLIDHGICFHVEDKLRTVVWDFAGEPIPPEYLKAIEGLSTSLKTASHPLVSALGTLLSPAEIHALARRAQRLLESGHFPLPPAGRRYYPWPPI